MKNVKDQVYAALDAVFENVTDQYPKDWAALPAVQYTEEDNKVYFRSCHAGRCGAVEARSCAHPLSGHAGSIRYEAQSDALRRNYRYGVGAGILAGLGKEQIC